MIAEMPGENGRRGVVERTILGGIGDNRLLLWVHPLSNEFSRTSEKSTGDRQQKTQRTRLEPDSFDMNMYGIVLRGISSGVNPFESEALAILDGLSTSGDILRFWPRAAISPVDGS